MANTAVKLTLTGRPITKKNSQQIILNRRTGRRMVIQGKNYRDYEKDCLWQLATYRGHKYKKTPCNLKAVYWMPNRRSWPDLLGLLQATADILEVAKIIDNDRYFVSFDGSYIAGVDKHNPRVEIVIAEVDRKLKPNRDRKEDGGSTTNK